MDEFKSQSPLKLEETVSRPLCYVPLLGVVFSIAFLIVEKNPKVKWDALQAILLWVTVVVLGFVLNVSYIARGLIPLVNLLGMIVAPLILAIRSSQNQSTKIPILAEVVNAVGLKVRSGIK